MYFRVLQCLSKQRLAILLQDIIKQNEDIIKQSNEKV